MGRVSKKTLPRARLPVRGALSAWSRPLAWAAVALLVVGCSRWPFPWRSRPDNSLYALLAANAPTGHALYQALDRHLDMHRRAHGSPRHVFQGLRLAGGPWVAVQNCSRGTIEPSSPLRYQHARRTTARSRARHPVDFLSRRLQPARCPDRRRLGSRRKFSALDITLARG